MPTKKDLKRVVRTRMKKTGESYTTARSQLLKKKNQSYADTAGMSDDAVRNKTGRDWQEWVDLLEAAGAAAWSHRETVALLHETHGVDGWWAQMVTVGYERIKGLRIKGQRRDGTFDVNKSKTFAVPVDRLYEAFSAKRQRERWLPGATVRTSTRDKSVRLLWEERPVEAYFAAKGPCKSQVQVQHRKLPSAPAAAEAKKYWVERFAALAELLG